ncbi:glyoxalase superfamily protein [Gordonia terrae]
MMMPSNVADARRAAQALRNSLALNGFPEPTDPQALEILSHTAGYPDWTSYSAALAAARPLFAVPVLRIFDVAAARRFYCEYLGCEVLFEHRFADDLPLYLRVGRGEIELDLSEHHGDGTPGSVVWIDATGLDALHGELRSRDHLTSIRPGIDRSAPGGPTMELIDPFHNVLRICEAR